MKCIKSVVVLMAEAHFYERGQRRMFRLVQTDRKTMVA